MKARSFVRNCWYVAGLSHEFETEKLTGHVIAKRPVVMWRTKDGDILAFDDRCAHKRFPLSKGRLMEDGTLECAYHGLRYDVSGKCVAIPAHPTGPISPKAQVSAFPIVEQDGVVWVWPGDPDRADDCKPPRTPEIGGEDFESIDSGPMEIPANYLLLIENLLDITHFYPLHDGNIGDIANSHIPIEIEEGEKDGNKFVGTVREVTNYEQPPYLQDWFGYDLVDRKHTHFMLNPGITRVEMQVAPPGKLGTEKDRGYVLFHTHTPIDETNHIWRWCINCPKEHMSGGDAKVSVAKRMASTFPDVVKEDLWALELQQKNFVFDDEGYTEVFLKPDVALRRARQIFAELITEEGRSHDFATAEAAE